MNGDDNHSAASERTLKPRSIFARRGALRAVLVLGTILCAVANLPWQLEEFSQDRQALASFQMVREGRWLYQQAPRSRTERSATKPPLIAWMSAGLFAITRSWDFAWRFPSFLAATLLAIALWRTAARSFGAEGAVIALSAFFFNMLTPRLATLVRTDMPLSLVVFVIGALIWKHVKSNSVWDRRDRLSIFVLLTLANYIKGPIVYVFLLPGVIVYEWLRPRRSGDGPAWCGWWPWLASLGLFLIWAIGGIVSQPGFFDQIVMHEFLGRFSSAEQAPHPPYFYIGHLLQKFAPWFELTLVLGWIGLREIAPTVRKAFSRMSPATRWLVCWIVGGLLIMSFVPSKRIDRIYPIVPPMCLLLAAQASRLKPTAYRWVKVGFAVSIVIAVHYVGYKRLYLGYHNRRDSLSDFGRQIRVEAAANHWRYDAIVSHDGALLLYLGKTQFIEADEATTKWNAGELDAIVAENDKIPALISGCHGAKLGVLNGIEQTDERGRTYAVVVRQ